MPLYTFIADYEGGIYTSQVMAPDATSAIFCWAENLEVKAIPRLNKKSRKKILKELRRDEAEGYGHVPLNGLRNAWFFVVRVKRKPMFVNFVQTESA